MTKNLRAIAEVDLGCILEDDVTGFGWSIKVTDPSGKEANLTGFSNDISELIDPDTGQAISGRRPTIAIRISLLTEEGLGLPKGIADATSKPWLVDFEDINGNPFTFKVHESNPDRALGIVTCVLEAYEK